MPIKIGYYRKNVYGKTLFYVADKDYANNIQALTGQKTLSADHMAALAALGVVFIETFAPSIKAL